MREYRKRKKAEERRIHESRRKGKDGENKAEEKGERCTRKEERMRLKKEERGENERGV